MNEPCGLIARDRVSVWHPFTQHGLCTDPLPITGAAGAWLSGSDGKKYLDMISSWWVNLHGHGRPELAMAISKQAMRLDHVMFGGITHQPAVELAERLLEAAELAGDFKVFYSDNGSTAVEAALKISFQYWRNLKEKRNLFAILRGGYHGDTVGAMSVGKSSDFFQTFEKLMFRTILLPVPCVWNNQNDPDSEDAAISEIAALLEEHVDDLACLIVEPLVQGAGGMRFHSPSFLKRLCFLFQKRGIPVIFDEVMTGFGRTGSFFAFQQTEVRPDIICVSKGITGGILPLAATIVANHLYEVFLGKDFSTAFAHGHSYTGNPVACAAGIASLDLHKSTKSLMQVERINLCMARHLELLAANSKIEHPRLIGAIAAFDLVGVNSSYSAGAGEKLSLFARDRGVLLRPMGNVVYIMPPYCTSESELDTVFEVLYDFFK